MEPENSLPRSQERATCLYLEPQQSTTRPPLPPSSHFMNTRLKLKAVIIAGSAVLQQ